LTTLFTLAGDWAGTPAAPRNAAPEVRVSQPVAREVSDYQDFTGRTEAAESVEVRARVSGYLVKTAFREGAEVRKGDLLYEIDPRPYQAELDQAQAQVELSRAQLKRAETVVGRLRAQGAAAARQELDEALATMEEAKARLKASEAALLVHKLNLDFCRVAAAIDGKAGRSRCSVGNLVKQDETLLTTIVGKDPMYAYFDMDERTYLDVRQAMRDGKLKTTGMTELPVTVGLANETGFPHKARLDFVNNRVDPNTGKLQLRVVLANADGRLVPGLFVRVRLTTSDPYKALLVPDEAVQSARDGKSVLVVNDKKVVERRKVAGSRQDGYLAVTEGLKPEDRVILTPVKSPPEGTTVQPVTVPQSGPQREQPRKP
jgi:RND family efflux transporter MFP subunit